MITQTGLGNLLRTFVSEAKEPLRVETLEIGNYDHSGTNQWSIVYSTHLSFSDIRLEGQTIIRVVKNIDGKVFLDLGDMVEFNSMRLLSENGETFAIRNFTPRVLTSGLRAVVGWDIHLNELCWSSPMIPRWDNIIGRPDARPEAIDSMVGMDHTHDNLDTLDKFSENDSGVPKYDGEDIVQIIWNKD